MIAMRIPPPSASSVETGGQQPDRADVRRHPVSGGEPYEGDPRWIMRRALGPARWGSTTTTSAPNSSTSTFTPPKPESGTPEVLDEGGCRSDHPRRRYERAPRDGPSPSSNSGSTSSTPTTRSGPHSEVDMRYKGALSMSDDCMTYRITVKEYAMKYGWHATFMQAAASRERLGHARASVALEGWQERLLRPRRPVFPLRHRQGVHRGAAQARRGDLRLCCSVGELLQAAGARLRGARLFVLVTSESLGADPGPALPPRQGAGHPRGVALPRSACQPLPLLRGMRLHAGLGDRAWLRAARADGAEHSPDPGGAPAAGIEQLPETLGEAIEIAAESPLVLRILGEHAFNRFIEIKRSEWEDYRVQVTPCEIEHFLPIVESVSQARGSSFGSVNGALQANCSQT